MIRLTYDPGTGELVVWEKTLAEFLVPNGTESLLEFMIRGLSERGAYFKLESM